MNTGPQEGFLEVGLDTEKLEVVINHPDLNPDANGVGHIVFSPDQARALAQLLWRHASEADHLRSARIIGVQ
jgi:hypothetical protein